MMQDNMIRATAMKGQVRAFAARTTNMIEEARNKHYTLPTATAALGRTMTAGAMLGFMLKGEEKLTIQVQGGGPIGRIVVDANAKGEVRGYVDHPDVDLPLNEQGKLDVSGAVGTEGFLYVTKDLALKDPYRGGVPIVSGELAEDFTYYFAKSEQTPSVVALGVLVQPQVLAAGGFIVQVMPDIPEETVQILEANIKNLPSMTSMLEEGLSLENILTRVLGDSVKVTQTMDVAFRCQCSRDRVEQTLISLGRKELIEIIEEEGKAEVVCHFCNEKYQLDKDELQVLISRLESQGNS